MPEQLLPTDLHETIARDDAGLAPELLDHLEALSREPVPQALDGALLRALVREAREARRLRRDARDQELLNTLRAQELALRWYGDLLDV